jgi:hypothetical protein
MSNSNKNTETTTLQPGVLEVTSANQIDDIIHDFQHELTRLGSSSTITACDHVIRLPGEAPEGHEYSFGADCTLSAVGKQTLHLFMCNDTMVGKFTLGLSGSATRNWIVSFTRKNCPPGG